jgi:hypothetical protein
MTWWKRTGTGFATPHRVHAVALDVGTDVHVPPDPRRTAVRGLARFIDEADRYPRVWRD